MVSAAIQFELDPFFVTQVRAGKCVLFAGAGLSAAAGYPSWDSLVRSVMQAGRTAHPELLVQGVEDLLAKERYPEAAAYLLQVMGAEAFHAALRAQLEVAGATPSALHQLLARFRFRAIVTTNFDSLIERAFGGELPVATQKDAAALARYLGEDRSFVFKVHGDLSRPDTIVLTKEEFARETLDNKALKSSFSALLLTSPLLFVGYSHSDQDLDLFLQEHVQVFGKEGARRYALMRAGDPKDVILQGQLRARSITVLPYADHAEVPRFLQQLLEAVQACAEKLTTSPPLVSLPSGEAAEGRRRRLPRRLWGRPAPAAATARYVVVIPGLMASRLSVPGLLAADRVIWLDIMALVRGGLSLLDLGAGAANSKKVSAVSVLSKYLQQLLAALQPVREVMPFAYDWRLDYRDNAETLRDFLQREIPEGASCDLVALQEGGLVARAYLADHRGHWRKLHGAQGGRLLMLGTPNHGAFKAVLTLLGRHELVRQLGMVDLSHSAEEVRRILATFPSLYQTLPSPHVNAAWKALYDRASYGRLEVSTELLANGLAFHDELADAVDPEHMYCILGDGHPTVVSVEDPQQLDQEQQWAMTMDGDGRVAHPFARLEKNGQPVPTYYAAGVEHGILGNSEQVARAVVDILERGSTDLLPTTPPVRR